MWKLNFRLLTKSGGGHSPMQCSLLFLQSLKEPRLSPHITSIWGQIQIHSENINEFAATQPETPSNLTINGIVLTLTDLPNPLGPSITYTPTNHTSHAFEEDSSSLGLQGFVIDSILADCHGGWDSGTLRHGKGSEDNSTKAKKDVVCCSCHRRSHLEVDCCNLAK